MHRSSRRPPALNVAAPAQIRCPFPGASRAARLPARSGGGHLRNAGSGPHRSPTSRRFVKEVIPYDLFAILLYSERQRGLSIRYAIGHRDEMVRNLVIPLGEGITGAAGADAASRFWWATSATTRAILSAFDAVRQRTRGSDDRARQAGGRDRSAVHRLDAFREEDRSLLQADRARVSRYRSTTRGCTGASSGRIARLKTLSHLSQEFSSILDLDELLGKIANASCTLWSPSTRSASCWWIRKQRCSGTASASATTSAWISTTFRSAKASPARRPNRARSCA